MPVLVGACAFAAVPTLPLHAKRPARGPRLRRRRRTCTASVSSPPTARPRPHVVILGGSGRVGLETAKALLCPDAGPAASPTPRLTLAGRDTRRAAAALQELRAFASTQGIAPEASFASVDVEDARSVHGLLRGTAGAAACDVVVHAAGPFQRRGGEAALRVLRAARECGASYLDVCDDVSHSAACRADAETAASAAAGHTAWVSTGVYPGVSNIMAARAAAAALERDGAAGERDQIADLRLWYHTAGSGGIGSTVLATTFLVLSEDAVTYERGERSPQPSASGLLPFDFGPRVGSVGAYLLSLPEVESLHTYVAPRASVSARFSTAPGLWNVLLRAMARTVPRSVLEDRAAMRALARISMPVVRVTDLLSGARTVMVAEATTTRGTKAAVWYEHDTLSQAVGEGCAAFARELIRLRSSERTGGSDGADGGGGGVFYPEELDAATQSRILATATRTCRVFETR